MLHDILVYSETPLHTTSNETPLQTRSEIPLRVCSVCRMVVKYAALVEL